MEGDEVWVATTWKAHGYDTDVQGVYDSREAAFEGLKAEPGMTVYADPDGCLKGRPRDENQFGARWARAEPAIVRGRARPAPEGTLTAVSPASSPASPTPEP